MKKIVQNFKLAIAGIITICVVYFLLDKNKFFCDYSAGTFNNVITPLVTIIAAFVYYFTLVEIKRTNSLANGNAHFSLLKEKLNSEQLRLQSIPLQISTHDCISTPLSFYSMFIEHYDKLVKEFEIYGDHIIPELEAKHVFPDKIEKYLSKLRMTLIELKYILKPIESLVIEIDSSEISEEQKNYMYDKISNLLKDYKAFISDRNLGNIAILISYHGQIRQFKYLEIPHFNFKYDLVDAATDLEFDTLNKIVKTYLAKK